MTVERIGLWHDPQHRYFAKYADKQAGPIPGVTGTIGVMDKPAVAYWRGTTVARIIAEKMDLYASLIETGGVEAAVSWAGQLPGHERDKAADVGSLVHILVEKILRKREVEVPVELVPYTIAFRNFLETRQPNIRSVEQACATLDGEASYGGTFDFLTQEADGWTLYDVKTWRKMPVPGRDMYAETGMQLAAYSRAQFIGSLGDPKRHRMPKVLRHAVLHLRPDLYDKGWQVYPFQATDAEYDAFMALLTAYRWKQTRSKLVIGEPHIVVPKEKVA